ncbi:MAG: 4-aminobutyrate aminotransferase / (S)-3-amino-2-methylpropionate transaminase / 5-aminovalerate, partial [Candidatus Eremiobacteraeota bacterium]|nr:4-aminobutyrate aminotransferase / (S)-3-amino-2-methylpropionate transaminase / 5-aminovalerate [Candidatus Eremiobacteraeota bacterium]
MTERDLQSVVTAPDLESITTAVPGPCSRALASELAKYEAPGVTYLGADYPVFWASASGATVTDVDGNRYLDLTSAFGVAA